MNNKCPAVVVAATGSGAGKTSFSIALVRALVRRGMRVQTFKVGPDFLDPTHLALASGRPCYNLDGWMCGRNYVLDIFARKTADADIAVIEGVMGLFDGASPENSSGSTAEIARWLDVPVLLVAGVHGVARSLAATIKGFCSFEDGLTIAGIIANQCGSERHAAWLSSALSSASLPPLAGSIPRNAFPSIPSRHLGLHPAGAATTGTLDIFAVAAEKHASIDTIISIASRPSSRPVTPTVQAAPPAPPKPFSIAVARDDAFLFYYADNLEALESLGAKIVYFSPLEDSALPKDIRAVYLGGGYPEEYAASLAGNTKMLSDLHSFASSGRPVYAECGGLMYLSQGITTVDGTWHPMSAILPFRTRMLPHRKALGYVEVTLTSDTLLGRKGDRLRGHEFHYSEIDSAVDVSAQAWKTAFDIRYTRKTGTVAEGFTRGSILASYAHLHLASNPAALEHFVRLSTKGTQP